MMHECEGNPLYGQLLAIHENAAQLIELAEQSFCASIGFIDWDSLDDAQRHQVHEWHRQLQKACEVVRDADL